MTERLQKVLAHAGVASRRAVEDMIRAGRVRVNGEVAALGRRIDPDKDRVELDGSSVPLRSDLVYYLLNKPRGVVTTASDPGGRPTVLDLVEASARVWPVGRLDVDSEGALILTNDGDLTHRLTHPRYAVPKHYLVEVAGGVGRAALEALRDGMVLEDGATQPAQARVTDRGRGRTLVELTITEGRNRQVRRMFEALDRSVLRLVRVGVGPLMLGRLKPGTARKLSLEEVRALHRAVQDQESR